MLQKHSIITLFVSLAGGGEEPGGGPGDDSPDGPRGQGCQRGQWARYSPEGREELFTEDQVTRLQGEDELYWCLVNRVAADEMSDNPTSITL